MSNPGSGEDRNQDANTASDAQMHTPSQTGVVGETDYPGGSDTPDESGLVGGPVTADEAAASDTGLAGSGLTDTGQVVPRGDENDG